MKSTVIENSHFGPANGAVRFPGQVLVLSNAEGANREIAAALSQAGFGFSVAAIDRADEAVTENPPDLIILDLTCQEVAAAVKTFQEATEGMSIPALAVLPRARLDEMTPILAVSDFITSPLDTHELTLRIRRLTRNKNGVEENGFIRAGELVIDLAKADVIIGGRRVDLTFREYVLLCFFASNPGRVFTREALLNKVWGYDYYGGDRTVDVHIRRLRSKIETDKLSFIETVRNIGYRFRSDL